MATCKDPQCATAHCMSSRYMAVHYHRCTVRSCRVCVPVQQAIRRLARQAGGDRSGVGRSAPEAMQLGGGAGEDGRPALARAAGYRCGLCKAVKVDPDGASHKCGAAGWIRSGGDLAAARARRKRQRLDNRTRPSSTDDA